MPDITTNPPLKRCTKCKRFLPLDEFHKSNFTNDGYKTQCKDCRRAYAGYNKRLVIPIIDGRKRCTKCGSLKPLNEFKKRSNGKPTQPCLDCSHKYEKEYLQSHRKSKNEYTKQYRAGNKEKVAAWPSSAYDKDRHAEYYRKNAYRINQYSIQWAKNNPDKAKANMHRRLARINNLPFSFTADDWNRALAYFDYRCAACGRPAGLFHTLAADHWIPVGDSNCPGTVPWNIVPLCHSIKGGTEGCNNTKSKRDPVEWLTSKFGPRKAKRILARIQAYFDSLKDDKP